MPAEGQQQAQGWSHLVAGSVAGCSAVLLLHPFDVIKTRLQVQDGLPGQLPVYRGTVDAVRTIVRTEGWRGLYAGLAPSILGSTVSWGAYLFLYERIKAGHRSRQGLPGDGSGGRLGAGWNLLSAAQAGAMVCVLTNPIWLVKTRLALQTRGALAAGGGGGYRGIVDALLTIGRTEGLGGYYKGFGPSLVLQTTHGALQFAAYEELKALASGRGGGPGGEPRALGSGEVSVYGAASKLLAAVATYPAQVVRSRLQQRSEGRALVYSSSWQAARLTWAREGLGGFYKGLAPSLARVMPQSAITLAVYEGIVALLERQAGRGAGAGAAGAQLGGGEEGGDDGGGHACAAQRQQRQWRPDPRPSLTDKMTPLLVAADAQAEQ